MKINNKAKIPFSFGSRLAKKKNEEEMLGLGFLLSLFRVYSSSKGFLIA